MLTVLAFCQNDSELARDLAIWIRDLGGVNNHELMLVHPPGASAAGIIEPLKEAFKNVHLLKTPDDRQGWPQGPNLMFRRAARQIQSVSPQPWLWLEPDAAPVTPAWLNSIAAEYSASKKPFMGVRVQLAKIPVHMSGIGVYPGNAPAVAPLLVTADKAPFDVNASEQIMPKLKITALIQHERAATFKDVAALAKIPPGVVLFHQCKDGSLIPLLREFRGEMPAERSEPIGEARGLSKGAEDFRSIDLAARIRGESPDFTPDTETLVEQLVGHLALIAKAGATEQRTVTQYLSASGIVGKAAPVRGTTRKTTAKPDRAAAEGGGE